MILYASIFSVKKILFFTLAIMKKIRFGKENTLPGCVTLRFGANAGIKSCTGQIAGQIARYNAPRHVP
jgi:hypothetical protein